MKRGDVFLADFEPTRGSEANKARPVLLVGNEASLSAAARFARGVVTVVPCTSNLTIHGAMHVALRPTELNGLRVPSKAQAEQIRSIDVFFSRKSRISSLFLVKFVTLTRKTLQLTVIKGFRTHLLLKSHYKKN